MLRIIPMEGRAPNDDARKLCLKIRKKRKWSQGQLALKLGVSRKMVESIEQSRYKTVSNVVLAALEIIDTGAAG